MRRSAGRTNRTVIAVAGIAAVVVVAYLGFELLMPAVNRCEAIFQQTAPSLSANVKFLETEGGLTLGRQQIQELTEKSQQVATNLKACCVMVGTGADADSRFNQCKAATADYDSAVAEAAAAVRELAAADEAVRAQRLDEIEARLTAIVETATAASDSLATQVSAIRESAPIGSAGATDSTATGEPAAAEPDAAPGQLRVRAALAAGGAPVNACYTVFNAEQDLHGNRRKVTDGCDTSAVFTLPAGDYVVDARVGNATRQFAFAVRGGEVTDEVVALDAGHLRLRAGLRRGGEAVNTCFTVFDAAEDLHGNRRKVTDGCDTNAVFTLPAGDYVVDARVGVATRQFAFAVRAGEVTDEFVALDAGHLRLRAALAAGGDAIDACYIVLDPEEDLHGNRRKVTDGCATIAVFTLPAGDFVVDAVVGNTTRRFAFSVAAGEVTDEMVALDAGQLRLRATLGAVGEATPACFYVLEPEEDLYGKRRGIADSCSENAVFVLPAGDYLVRAEAGDAAATAALEVQAGAVTDRWLTLVAP